MVRSALVGSWRKDSALYVNPRSPFSTATFLIRLALNSRTKPYARYSADLQALAAGSRQRLSQLEDAGLKVDINKAGFLYVYRNRANAEAVRTRYVNRGLTASPVVAREGLLELEPQLGPRAQAGFVLEDMWSLDPGELIDSLVDHLRGGGVDICEHHEVLELVERADSVTISTVKGEVNARQALVAAGVWSAELCERAGLPLEILAGKGYSFDVSFDRPLDRVIQFDDAHVVATPMGNRVRMAGTMEFDRDPTKLNRGRIESIIAAADGFVIGVDWAARQNEWVGPRPMTVDGMPYVGPVSASSRIFVAAGHNMHGLSLAPATAELVADLMAGSAGSPGVAFLPARAGSARSQRRR